MHFIVFIITVLLIWFSYVAFQLASVMDDLITQLRSTLDDDNRETRLLTCQVLSKIFFLVGDRLHRDHRLYNMYPEILKRLDDSSDDVRIAATDTFSAYFGCLCKEYEVALYRAHLEEIFKGLLLHMDDPQEEVQMAVLGMSIIMQIMFVFTSQANFSVSVTTLISCYSVSVFLRFP